MREKKTKTYSETSFKKRRNQILLLIKNPEFQKEVADLRNKYRYPKKGFVSPDKKLICIQKLLKNKGLFYLDRSLQKDIEQVLKKFKLSYYWKNFLENYIVYNRIDRTPGKLKIILEKNKKTDKLDLFIQIYEDTRKEDLVYAWSVIQKHQSFLQGYKKATKKKNLSIYIRNLEIIKLFNQGMAVSEIAKEIYKKFTYNVDIKNENIYNLTEDNIRKIIKNNINE